MASFFISYRRADSHNAAGRLGDQLGERFGEDHVFMDVDDIGPGVKFEKEIDEKLSQVDVLLVVIGPSWLELAAEDGSRRLDNPDDIHRREIATALRRDVLVIPVLVDGATMPKVGDLPDGLKQLTERNYYDLRPDKFKRDAEHLVEQIARGLRKPRKRWHLAAAALVALVAFVVLIWVVMKPDVPEPPPSPPPPPVVVRMPDVRNLEESEGKRQIEILPLQPAAEIRSMSQPSTEFPRGTIAGQDPSAGSPLEPGAEITLTVSDGPPAPSDLEIDQYLKTLFELASSRKQVAEPIEAIEKNFQREGPDQFSLRWENMDRLNEVVQDITTKVAGLDGPAELIAAHPILRTAPDRWRAWWQSNFKQQIEAWKESDYSFRPNCYWGAPTGNEIIAKAAPSAVRDLGQSAAAMIDALKFEARIRENMSARPQYRCTRRLAFVAFREAAVRLELEALAICRQERDKYPACRGRQPALSRLQHGLSLIKEEVSQACGSGRNLLRRWQQIDDEAVHLDDRQYQDEGVWVAFARDAEAISRTVRVVDQRLVPAAIGVKGAGQEIANRFHHNRGKGKILDAARSFNVAAEELLGEVAKISEEDGEAISCDLVPLESATEDDRTAESTTEDDGTAESTTEGDGTPESATEGDGTPESATEDDGLPDPATEDDGTPDPATEDDGTPDPPDPVTEDDGTPDPVTEDDGTPDPATGDDGSVREASTSRPLPSRRFPVSRS